MLQRDLAVKAKVSVSRLCRIELGTLEPYAGEIERCAAAMDLTMPEFYGEPARDPAREPA